jgi:hypothetical protein
MVMVFVTLAMSFSGNCGVASMLRECQQQRVGARKTSARVARFDVGSIRGSNACTVLVCPFYNTGKSGVPDDGGNRPHLGPDH